MLDERALTLRDILKGNELADLEEALSRIEAWLTSDMLPEAKGVVIFVGGRFVLPIQFAAPLPN